MDVTQYEELFKDEFLKNAPLYTAASKVKLPYEDLKIKATQLYRGSLNTEERTIEELADYRLIKETVTDDIIRAYFVEMAADAGKCVDGLIRSENLKSLKESDFRQTTNLVVTNIFDHNDGRRNLQLMLQREPLGPSLQDPASIVQGWVAYRFYFACAAIRQEYKATA